MIVLRSGCWRLTRRSLSVVNRAGTAEERGSRLSFAWDSATLDRKFLTLFSEANLENGRASDAARLFLRKSAIVSGTWPALVPPADAISAVTAPLEEPRHKFSWNPAFSPGRNLQPCREGDKGTGTPGDMWPWHCHLPGPHYCPVGSRSHGALGHCSCFSSNKLSFLVYHHLMWVTAFIYNSHSALCYILPQSNAGTFEDDISSDIKWLRLILRVPS